MYVDDTRVAIRLKGYRFYSLSEDYSFEEDAVSVLILVDAEEWANVDCICDGPNVGYYCGCVHWRFDLLERGFPVGDRFDVRLALECERDMLPEYD